MGMDVYIRVSRKGDRDGESYRSPAIQEDACRRWAKANKVHVVKVIKDEDVSGGKAVAARGVEELIKRAEKGVSDGVIVMALDRFGRDEVDASLAIKRLSDAGARLVSTEGDDSSNEDDAAYMAIKLRLMFAQSYLKRVSRNWKQATESAARDGIQCGKANIGYRRADEVEELRTYDPKGDMIRDGRLVLDRPELVEAVREAFTVRAQGGTYTEGTAVLEAALGRKLSRNTLRMMVKCRTYLGEIKRGDVVVKDAHEAIVTPELFAAASVRHTERTVPHRPRGETAASLTLLSGLVKCAGCGGPCKVQRSRGGEAYYVCAPGRVGNPCPPDRRAGAMAKAVDEHVVWLLANDLGPAQAAAGSERERWLGARERLRAAEAELEVWMDDEELSAERRKAMIVKAEAKADAARVALYELPNPDIDDDANVVWLNGKPVVYERFGEDHDADRRWLRSLVGEVLITKSKRGRWEAISERVVVRWKDGSEAVDQRAAA